MKNGNKCPITIVTGFLGSGKTTLLGNMLRGGLLENVSVIINEYGQVGLDHRLIRRIEERTTLLSGGCVCCNRRDDLISELLDMLNSHQSGNLPLDRVIVETTGLADPAPILFSITTHPVLTHHYSVDMVVTCLDAINGGMHLANNPESIKQVATADKIIITKTDISQHEATHHLIHHIRHINPSARVLTSANGHVSERLFDPDDSMTLPSASDILDKLEQAGSSWDSGHATNIRSMAVQFEEPLDWLAFGIWLSMLLQKHGEKIFRIKGIVDVGEDGPIVINGVQHIIHPPRHLEDWRDYEARNSQIVFIMRDIEPFQIMDSLTAFQNLIGAEPKIQEINLNPFE
ncbi:MAG: GTP-binding protein [Synergistaceae bacterium]|nr:GTP-binding protein [Synergistaceae bacterium]